MAKRKVNKAAIVRDYLAKHPNTGPLEVAEALKAHKIEAVYVTDVKMKLKRRTRNKLQQRQRSSTRMAYTSSEENIIVAAEFIRSCGGIDEALEAFEIAQKVAQTLD